MKFSILLNFLFFGFFTYSIFINSSNSEQNKSIEIKYESTFEDNLIKKIESIYASVKNDITDIIRYEIEVFLEKQIVSSKKTNEVSTSLTQETSQDQQHLTASINGRTRQDEIFYESTILVNAAISDGQISIETGRLIRDKMSHLPQEQSTIILSRIFTSVNDGDIDLKSLETIF